MNTEFSTENEQERKGSSAYHGVINERKREKERWKEREKERWKREREGGRKGGK